jgi:hypothetical protein
LSSTKRVYGKGGRARVEAPLYGWESFPQQSRYLHKECSVHEAFTGYSSVLLFLLTEEQSSRRRERKRAFEIAGNGEPDGKEKLLQRALPEAGDVRACSHVAGAFGKTRCDLEAEPEL